MIKLSIDGKEVCAEPGATILEAARQNGIDIPTMCYDKRLTPYGSSFFCVVEVSTNGSIQTVPACVTAVADGMKVATHTPEIIEARRTQLTFILRSHPLSCPTCDAAGDCRLQKYVHEYKLQDVPFPRETRDYHVDDDSHFIRFNMDLCTKCGMCVRICEELQGECELTFVGRGTKFDVSTDFGRPLDCEFCGQCVQICPVGAISSKWLVGTGRRFELSRIHTVCSFCSLGCRLTLHEKKGKVVYVTSPQLGPNDGSLCVKGRYGWPYVYSDQRLTAPLIRKEGTLQPVEWDEALRFVAENFTKIKETSTAQSLAALGSQRLTNEEAYLFNRFVRTVLGTPHLDHAGGYAYRPLLDGLARAFGYPAGTNSIQEIRHADVILLLGADLTESHPVAKNEVILATAAGKGKVVVVDSVRTKLCERPGIAIITSPGTEHLVAYAMLREILDKGLVDGSFLDPIPEGLDDFLASLEPYAPDWVAKLTKTDPDHIRQAAAEYAHAAKGVIIVTAGPNSAANNLALAQAAANLALVTGKIGRESCGVNFLGEKANSQGAVDMGLAPDLLPGFHSILDPRARDKFENRWKSPVPLEKGLDAHGIMQNAENGQIRGLYIVGENPMESYPDRRQTTSAVKNLEFLVVQDLFLTSTAKMAHAVLPAKSFAEKSGTFTSSDRRIQILRPVFELPGPRSDMAIFEALAAGMNAGWINYSGPEEVMLEIAELVDVYRGVSYAHLGEQGIQWPCADREDQGTKLLYDQGFPGGKASLIPAPPIQAPSSDGSALWLVPRVVKFHSGSMSQWSPSLMDVCPEGWAEMNAKDMRNMDLREGDTVKIATAKGVRIELRVKDSERAVKGCIIAPWHFAALKLNNLTGWDRSAVRVRVKKAQT